MRRVYRFACVLTWALAFVLLFRAQTAFGVVFACVALFVASALFAEDVAKP